MVRALTLSLCCVVDVLCGMHFLKLRTEITHRRLLFIPIWVAWPLWLLIIGFAMLMVRPDFRIATY